MTTMVKTISNMVKVVDLQLSPAEYLVVRSALVNLAATDAPEEDRRIALQMLKVNWKMKEVKE